MTIRRTDNVGIVVNDLAAAIAFFVERGLELEGQTTVEGSVVDRLVGLETSERTSQCVNPLLANSAASQSRGH